MKVRSRPISLQVTVEAGEDPLTPREIKGYFELAQGPASFRFASDSLEPLAGAAPILGLRMADICAQQGALGLAYRVNGKFLRRATFDRSLASPEAYFRGVVNAALLTSGAMMTLRNAVRQGEVGEIRNSQQFREHFERALPLLEAALLDKPDDVLSYVLLFARARLLSPAAAMATLRCIEQHADHLPSGGRAEAQVLLTQLVQQDQVSLVESAAGAEEKLEQGIRRRHGFGHN